MANSSVMAEGRAFVCGQCGKKITAWDDGNPYYLDELGAKQYAYHPSMERERCTGNDDPHLCLHCGKEFMVDSKHPRSDCPECRHALISPTFSLEGKECPFCEKGRFIRDPSYNPIS